MKVNLLPYQIAQKAGPNWRAVFSLAGVVLLAAVTLIFYVALEARVRSFEKRITSAEVQFQEYAGALERKSLLEQLQAAYSEKSAFIEELSGEGVKWNDIMDELRQIIPRTVVLGKVISDDTGLISIEGRAGSLQAIVQFMVNIQKGHYVTEPDIQKASWSVDAGCFTFSMTCRAKQQVVSQDG
jgi:Tfp pilus assembly protein PilN